MNNIKVTVERMTIDPDSENSETSLRNHREQIFLKEPDMTDKRSLSSLINAQYDTDEDKLYDGHTFTLGIPTVTTTERMAPDRMAADQMTLEQMEPLRMAPDRKAPKRKAPERKAPVRMAPVQMSPGRMAPERMAP